MRRAPHYIAIEGPLRVGKTRLATALAQHIRGRALLDPAPNPHLEAFYRGRAGAAFRAQMHFLIGRYSRLAEANVERAHLPVVSDYLFEKDKLFAYLNLDDDEISIYDDFYKHFKSRLPEPDLAVYLKAGPEHLRAQLAAGKPGFESGIADAYLQRAVRAFDHFFSRYKSADVLVVDAAQADIENSPDDLRNLLEELGKPVTGTQFFLPLGS